MKIFKMANTPVQTVIKPLLRQLQHNCWNSLSQNGHLFMFALSGECNWFIPWSSLACIVCLDPFSHYISFVGPVIHYPSSDTDSDCGSSVDKCCCDSDRHDLFLAVSSCLVTWALFNVDKRAVQCSWLRMKIITMVSYVHECVIPYMKTHWFERHGQVVYFFPIGSQCINCTIVVVDCVSIFCIIGRKSKLSKWGIW